VTSVLPRLGAAAATLALSVGALVLTTAPASASVTMPDRSLQGPACAKVEHWNGSVSQTVKVTNNCSYVISYVVNRVGRDSPCIVLNPGEWQTFQWPRYGLPFQGISWNCV
jgi:hypothetical protein